MNQRDDANPESSNDDILNFILHKNVAAVRSVLSLDPSLSSRPGKLVCRPIELALYGENREMLRLLLGSGVDLASPGSINIPIVDNLMMEACDEGNLSGLLTLLEAGLSPNSRMSDGERTLLMRAAWGTPEAVRLLLRSGADPNVQDPSGWTALMYAADYDTAAYVETDGPLIVRALLDAGANPSARNTHGKTALEIALGQSQNTDSLHAIIELLRHE